MSADASVATAALQRIRADVQSMHAYAVQDAAGMVKLDAMENPHTLPADLQAALGVRLGALAINRYPGPRIDDLKRALAAHVELPAGQSLVLGNGSDEIISLLAMACDVPAADTPDGLPPAILAPLPGFVMYAITAQLQGLRFVGVPLSADFQLDAAAMCAAIAAHRPAITYLAYPNNPTANLWDADAMARVIAAAATVGGLVVVDEAYQPFASRSWQDAVRRDPAGHAHVLLMRTLSKFGLAGVRLGYLMGPAALVAQIDKVRPPYNISVLNAECALFALEHAAVFEAQAADIRAQRARLADAMAALPGVQVWPSDANMLLVRMPGGEAGADRVFDALRRSGILVKNVSRMHALLAGCLRLTVGTEGENTRMLAALQQALAPSPLLPLPTDAPTR
ncbi:histidinol-phosphate transaminase [Xylophilus ampelinus]|uniref:Histidinol-phosphate aminotransferase n=1 Tax=Xylophilus ampelinus TaxID=54067 RepID=A0A318SHK2_9BURK|nr:histidinol-phosphate transaminase [Xylophilus ampelinus]MCS4510126.1 histidinol-phosphate transaminase [Xylophilus ampelinus]PYE78276.1 histidinol-phosphate aminotransferase [Xylophilus ampelinus]